jgi:GntR family transcriptional regulator, rspAB operon transcriptional repressor
MKPNDLPRSLKLDRKRHAAPQVFERLRDMIIAIEMAPGTVLPRAELAERFGVSQTPVRDALMRLEAEGLVDVFPQHATVVSRIDLAAARQAHFLRRAIELELVRTLAERPDEALIARLRATIAQQRALRDLKNYREFVVADRAFHQHMYEAAGVVELWDLVRRRSGHIDRLRHLHLPEEGKTTAIVRDHTEIVDSIARGDVTGAQSALRKHLSGTLTFIDQIRRRYPEYVTGE